jgi:hypothetical protein
MPSLKTKGFPASNLPNCESRAKQRWLFAFLRWLFVTASSSALPVGAVLVVLPLYGLWALTRRWKTPSGIVSLA